MENIQLSIVIPTRNREFYCIKAIKFMSKLSRSDFEVIIQDNSDSDEIMNFIKALDDNRIKYYRVEGRINSALNIDLAIQKSVGEYVTMIGDDDLILPSLFEAVHMMKNNNIDCLTSKLPDSFIWNDSIDENAKSHGNLYQFPRSKKNKLIDSKKELKKLLKSGITNYSSINLPKLYHGIVSRKVLNEIYNKLNHYVEGLSPDICLSVAIALFADNHIIIGTPLTIAGVCPASTSYDGLKKKDFGFLKEAPHLFQKEDYKWDERIPAFYSSSTIWAESALKTLTQISGENNKWITYFKKNNLDSILWLKYRNRIKDLGLNVNFGINHFFIIKFLMSKYKSKFRSLIWRIKGRKVYKNIQGWEKIDKFY